VGSGRAVGGVDLGVVVYLSDVGSDSEGGIFFSGGAGGVFFMGH